MRACLAAMPLCLLSASSPAWAQIERGIASVYSTESGTRTASGQRLYDSALTAAHKTLPFGTKVKVTNERNGRSVVVTINDRGPFIKGRSIDLTRASAAAIGLGWSVAPVVIEVWGCAPSLGGSALVHYGCK